MINIIIYIIIMCDNDAKRAHFSFLEDRLRIQKRSFTIQHQF